MRRLFLASAALLAMLASPAMAADLPAKAPLFKAPPPVAIFSWSGFYVGANIGYSWGRSRNDWDVFAAALTVVNPTVCPPALCVSGSDTNKINGAIGGLQAGYNWHMANFVVGLETDVQASGQRGSQVFSAPFATSIIVGVIPVVGTVSAAYTQRLAWLATLRGRLGFAADRWLVYATGGLAYGRVTIDGTATATGFGGDEGGPGECTAVPGSADLCPLASFRSGVTKAGWTLGAGAEGAIADGWSWKIEYLHVDLGTVTTTFATLPGCFGGTAPGGGGCVPMLAGSGTISSRITDEIVRVGINYRFGWGKAPVVARY
jgi:outer membrane immunogenic protein